MHSIHNSYFTYRWAGVNLQRVGAQTLPATANACIHPPEAAMKRNSRTIVDSAECARRWLLIVDRCSLGDLERCRRGRSAAEQLRAGRDEGDVSRDDRTHDGREGRRSKRGRPICSNERYDLSDKPAEGVTMSRGKAVQGGVRAKLPTGVTWDELADDDAGRNSRRRQVAQGFLAAAASESSRRRHALSEVSHRRDQEAGSSAT